MYLLIVNMIAMVFMFAIENEADIPDGLEPHSEEQVAEEAIQ